MKYAAAITMYNPERGQIEHCREYVNSFDMVYILDNSEEEIAEITETFRGDNIRYVKMEGNIGLPAAFNYVLDLDEIIKFDFLCTLDQDSIFTDLQIQRMKSFIESCRNDAISSLKYQQIAIFAPVIDYGNGVNDVIGFEERKRVIASGSFLRLEIIRDKNIRYDNNYFIDKFEIDLCQQLVLQGYKIIVFLGAKLLQRLGDNKNGVNSGHTALRHYYLFRNRFYFNHKFYSRFKRAILNCLQTGRHVFLIIKFEDEKCYKIKQLLYAISDYRKGKMGKRLN